MILLEKPPTFGPVAQKAINMGGIAVAPEPVQRIALALHRLRIAGITD